MAPSPTAPASTASTMAFLGQRRPGRSIARVSATTGALTHTHVLHRFPDVFGARRVHVQHGSEQRQSMQDPRCVPRPFRALSMLTRLLNASQTVPTTAHLHRRHLQHPTRHGCQYLAAGRPTVSLQATDPTLRTGCPYSRPNSPTGQNGASAPKHGLRRPCRQLREPGRSV
ncbi:hypothetical protein PsYK624_100990 [Phanerochaete sordida]|uniref:Uncharacterized protein n=1 Tax=Phanerochaete sordida TaxID=48140 RepID=A0A9P3GHX6_9APHY|nr:hypothetical protein PsYK624_100990 [Phanerochaete sordida]